ncbi:Mitochondria-eating protein [Frankliniella fusca]|uniref:Mitochondria-eating protein n=1 Tax=Frankliniella fusca TaxID=407009 RepID=A0AAE1LHY6_9NEOP|nr:Mitochondria-eating protein [Frankliniella fusca]
MHGSRFSAKVLELMKEVTEDDEDSSDISGYHSDSDSAIMMSGNSPYVSKRARYNFLTRSETNFALQLKGWRENTENFCGSKPPEGGCGSRQAQGFYPLWQPTASVFHGNRRFADCDPIAQFDRFDPRTTIGLPLEVRAVSRALDFLIPVSEALPQRVRSSSKCSRLSVLGGALSPLGPKLSTSSGVSSGLSSGGSVPDSSECVECTGRGGGASSGSASSSEEAASSSPTPPTASAAPGSGGHAPQRLRHLKHKKDLLKSNSVPGSALGGSRGGASSAVPCCQGCQPRAVLQVLPPVSVSAPGPGGDRGERAEREAARLRAEVETLRSELAVAKTRLTAAEETSRPSSLPSAGPEELGAERLVACYANLYSQARVDTLDALDALPALRDAAELKSKILFSVVVKDHIRRILHLPTPSAAAPAADQQKADAAGSAAAQELEQHVSTYLRRTVDTFDLTKSIDEVCSQIWATLYDYPSLKTCTGLLQYVRDSVRLAWALVNQNPTYVLEYEQRHFRRDVHVRFHSSNPDSEAIRTYLWPALLEGAGGPCVHKAVVLT